MSFTFGSLFAGIGGLDLGLERAGMECRWQVEINDYANKILEKHWPDVRRFRDMREVGKHNLESVDLICGGFPCQDISNAGKRAGIEGERSGLWSEYARIICELRPRFVLVENVAALLGRAMGRVLGDLAASGYDAEWQVLSARAFGAPHLRERVFIIANRDGERIEGRWQEPIYQQPAFSWCKDVRSVEDLQNRPDIPQPLLRRKSDGVSVAVDKIGNAVVPQVAQWIGERIMQSVL